ncbi:ATP synthase F0, A subunit [Thermodesulfatator indicus DSM 15286]|uniref:ATP synthase subunit a n=1 Tax=Thermodesulfatator indicus (strain DSM 15286 / JCM 11887 / CIR29812) TaxID=667014 RepID=F8A945_THEID|nr:F0F1 ATP synthase subunit A [Thermodesulfatator indicus]AEH45173.1 ATP synthase F0, A subunit [Thermodesulfatator indicus DSM 15286]
MEHPLLFLCFLLELLGIPSGWHYYEHADQYGILAQIFAPHMVHSYFVCILIIVLIITGLKKREFIPKGAQNFWEFVLESLYEYTKSNVPSSGKLNLVPYVFPLIVCFAVYILFCNYIGIIPGFMAPTANINVTLGLTLITIVYYHFLGLRFQGLKYFKQFLGPIPYLIPLIAPAEIFGHIGRIISLSVRLFANMMAKELLIGILLFLAGPFFAPLPILLLGVLVAFIQMLIFITLSLAYFAGAVEEHH